MASEVYTSREGNIGTENAQRSNGVRQGGNYDALRKQLQSRTYEELDEAIKVMASAKNDVLDDLIRVYSEVALSKRR